MKKDTGWPACSRCGVDAALKQGNQWLCEKHYRFGQMRAGAKRHGKAVPSHDQLESLVDPSMLCPDCHIQMNWRAKDGQSTVASLQHYRDGSLGIVCRTCNTRHAFMPGDTYRAMPKDHKLCKKCGLIKKISEFSADNNRSGQMKVQSKCKSCNDNAVNQWKEDNREKYNDYQRAYRSKRKVQGNPVCSGS